MREFLDRQFSDYNKSIASSNTGNGLGKKKPFLTLQGQVVKPLHKAAKFSQSRKKRDKSIESLLDMGSNISGRNLS